MEQEEINRLRELHEAAILKGTGRINGDGWKDTTRKGEIVFVWNSELPPPYAPGQFPRLGNEVWSASAEQYHFMPATADDVPAIRTTLLAQAERVKVLEGLLESALNVLENSGAESGYCMCGDPVASHTIGSGHSPVDSHSYMAEQVIVECRTALEQTGATNAD